MEIISEIIGNTHSPEWHEKLHDFDVENIYLDQWVAQKSRFLAKGDEGNEYPVALKRHTQIQDGDIIIFDEDNRKAAVLRLKLNDVLVIDLSGIENQDKDTIIRTCVELGHAIGNQHWPAVTKGTKVYVPLTVDKKVMMAVMDTHNIPGISYKFEEGIGVIPFLAPDEIRNLFGGAGQESHSHEHHHHDHPHVH